MMKRARVLKPYSLRNKKDNIARVFKVKETIAVGETEHDIIDMDIDSFEIWERGTLLYKISDITGDARPRALGLADGINHWHVYSGDKWPIKESW